MGSLRAVGAGSESPTIVADADAFKRPIIGAGGVDVDDDEDISGGIRLADAGGIGFVDAVWVGYFLYWVPFDSLGCWFAHGFLRCWDCFDDFHVGSFDSLLRHGPSFAGKGDSCLETFVKNRVIQTDLVSTENRTQHFELLLV